MNDRKLDAVIPLTLKDYPRFEILHTSLKLFFKDLGKCWIVTPDHEFEQIKSLISDEQYCVIPESSLVPEFKIFRSSNRFSIFKSVPGWFKQQIIKIAIADKIETDFYLTLDADVICTKPVYFEDLIKDGRAVCYIHQTHTHHDWYGWAEEVLKMTARSRELLHNVTPAVLSKQAMLELQTYLTQVYHKTKFPLRRRDLKVVALKFLTTFLPKKSTLRHQLLSWRSYLSVCTPWTEYGLYYIFLEETNRFDKYHIEVTDPIYTNDDSVWYKETFESWDVEKVFSPESSHFFVIVQGWLDLDIQEVWQKVDQYLNKS
ncbi:DUF6492 family protein [Phormidesmis priestleyi]|uniref:DUF6492 family protein n=1 Tax=Phormidesmis priestleyi TaxID=268141 RepID=UPI000932B4DF|nr:DUF6492 family protein [Phormidesmis priestleyi]